MPILDGADLVICWSVNGKRAFAHVTTGWATGKSRYEEQSALLTRGAPMSELPYHRLARPGGGIPPHPRNPVGFFHANRIEVDHAADRFACVYMRPRVVPILGPAAAVEIQMERFRAAGADHVWYTPVPSTLTNASAIAPSEAKQSVGARRALDVVIADVARMDVEFGALSSGELVWIGETARADHRLAPSLVIAETAAHMALARRRTPGALNLLGGVLRDQHRHAHSLEVFTESIELCESARWNPFGYIGLAATLRRLGRLDEAWDHLKRPRKYYADNQHALNVKAALAREMGFDAAA
jgi:tetratricopeptide (TPR) repeat protein